MSESFGGIPKVVGPLYKALERVAPDLFVSLLADDRSEGGNALRCFGPFVKALRSGAILIHDHGAWLPFHCQIYAAAKLKGLPFVLSPHGALEAWALQHKRAKKTVAWYLYQKRLVNGADLVVVNSQLEYESVRRLGCRAPIAVVEHGVDIPLRCQEIPAAPVLHRRALFLSRINPKKGVIELLRAWRDSRARRELGFSLSIYGNCDDEDYGREVHRALEELDLGDSVVVGGPVYGNDKWRVFDEHDFFVLPSFSENFGIVVLEALYAGLPVITTTGMPWAHLEAEGLGVTVAPNADAVRAAIDQFAEAAVADSGRTERRKAARRYVEKNYTWDAIANKYALIYRWLIKEGGEPEYIYWD